MEALFLKILNMSITAGWIVLAVIAVRLLLKKAPKWIAVLMWGLAGIRLVCPLSLESIFSLIPSAETIPGNILYTDTPEIHSGVAAVNSVVNPILSESLAPAVGASVNPMQVIVGIASVVWLVGIGAMLLYTALSYLAIHKKVKEAVPFRGNIWLCDHVDTPFILGVLRPRIYLPSAMGEGDMEYVIAHEKAHLKRRDHWWKPLGFLLLTVYWFQPILWIAYILLCRDIELACDEKVIRDMGTEHKKPYSDALVHCSVRRRMVAACPLAFGEVGVKERVKSVLHYKKPAFWILAAAVIACIVVAVCFLTNPKSSNRAPDPTNPEGANQNLQLQQLSKIYPDYFGIDASNGLDVYVWQMAESSYSFGLLPHSAAQRDNISPELLKLKGASASQMRQILATYHVDESNIHIIPWQNPLSSYIAEPWIISEGESTEEKLEEYRGMIWKMLFGKYIPRYDDPFYFANIFDSAVFDVDGDGKDENCVLAHGITYGVTSFSFSAGETGAERPEYFNTFIEYYEIWSDLAFVKCDDGVVRVQGIDEQEQPHLFDIAIINGDVHLIGEGREISGLVVMAFPDGETQTEP